MRKDDESGGEQGSAESRIEALEKSRKLDRLLLFGLAAVLACTLLGGLTLSLLSSSEKAGEGAGGGVPAQALNVEKQLASLQAQITQQNQERAAQQESELNGMFRATEEPNSASQVARTLVGQEQGFQAVVKHLKLAMRDLAAMLPGSRSWLDQYSEALNLELTASQARASQIQLWAAGRVAEEPKPAAPK
ncbi:MAG: hypothetical protein ACOH2I_02065 [Pseudomonas sp.]